MVKVEGSKIDPTLFISLMDPLCLYQGLALSTFQVVLVPTIVGGKYCSQMFLEQFICICSLGT